MKIALTTLVLSMTFSFLSFSANASTLDCLANNSGASAPIENQAASLELGKAGKYTVKASVLEGQILITATSEAGDVIRTISALEIKSGDSQDSYFCSINE